MSRPPTPARAILRIARPTPASRTTSLSVRLYSSAYSKTLCLMRAQRVELDGAPAMRTPDARAWVEQPDARARRRPRHEPATTTTSPSPAPPLQASSRPDSGQAGSLARSRSASRQGNCEATGTMADDASTFAPAGTQELRTSGRPPALGLVPSLTPLDLVLTPCVPPSVPVRAHQRDQEQQSQLTALTRDVARSVFGEQPAAPRPRAISPRPSRRRG